MKKILVFIFLLPIIANAQTEKGSWLVSGSFSLAFNGVKEEIDNDSRDAGSHSSLSLTPKVGYFVIDGIAVGTGIDWHRESDKDIDQDKTVFHSLSVAPFIRYYTALGPFFHGQLMFGGGSEKHKPEVGTETIVSDFSAFGYTLGIGYPFFLKDHVSLEPLLSFRSQNYNFERNIIGTDEVTEKYRGLLIQIGITYYIF